MTRAHALTIGLLTAAVLSLCAQFPRHTLAEDAPRAKHPSARELTADHSKFQALQADFKNGEAVTQACLTCHNQADTQLRKTPHWEWHIAGDASRGKGGMVVNNYCISSNKLGDQSCNDCHIGWNAKLGSVNCLNCHSQKMINWNEAFGDISSLSQDGDESALEIVADLRAQLLESITSIGQPSAKNCGSCHFYSGGGDRVKRGDMGSDLLTASRDLDVHLSKEGAGLSCIDCHNTRNHQVPGRKYNMSAAEEREQLGEPDFKSFLRCEACHTTAPHKNEILNDHFKTIACQTCHIPLLARQEATKVWWDWSKAGQTKDGKPFDIKDESGEKTYMSIKGEFRWEKNVLPEYAWFDGTMENHLLNEPVDPTRVVDLQWPNGRPHAPGSKIYPFKVHRGKQPWDPETKLISAPMLSGDDGYWKTLDWQRSISKGMELMELPYSGKYDFIETRFMYPSNHTVAPKEKALRCDDCHHRAGDGRGSRMAGVPGVYVAGRGDLIWLTRIAWLAIALTALGIFCHAIFRMVVKLRRGE